MHKTMLAVLMTALVMLAGCEKQPAIQAMPEVNDTNCQIEAIKKIEDKATREEFAGLCSTRPRIAPTQNPLNWFELLDKTAPKGQETKP